MNNVLSDIEIHRHMSKREVEDQNHVNKRNAEYGDKNVMSNVILIKSCIYSFKLRLPIIRMHKISKIVYCLLLISSKLF